MPLKSKIKFQIFSRTSRSSTSPVISTKDNSVDFSIDYSSGKLELPVEVETIMSVGRAL